MKPQDFLDTEKPPRLHVGMRIVKTVIAVYLSSLGWYIFDEIPFFAMIAALLCMQSTANSSFVMGFNRMSGTLVGGILGAISLYIARFLGIHDIYPLYTLLMCLMLICVIEITLLIRKPTISAFACIVFLSVTVVNVDVDPLAYSVYRMLETLYGVVIALIVNLVLPAKKRTEEEKKEEAPKQ